MLPKQFLDHVIVPTLKVLAVAEPQMDSMAARQLMLGTAIMESNLEHLEQIGGGPALSMFQIEPRTFHDVYDRYLGYRHDICSTVNCFKFREIDPLSQLAGNQHFACAIARVKYWMIPRKLPELHDLEGMGEYWAKYYNAGGKGTMPEFVLRYNKLAANVIPGFPQIL